MSNPVTTINNHPITVDAARGLVRAWRRTFRHAPASVCLTLMEIESGFRPAAHAKPTAEALARGAHPAGAWGLLQLLQPTALDMARKLSRMVALFPEIPREVGEALELWDPVHPECLTNPRLGSLLGVAYLDHLAERFGPDLSILAAAYHNGPGFMADFMLAGKRMPDDLPPKGKEYVHRARVVWPKYASDDVPAEPAAVA